MRGERARVLGVAVLAGVSLVPILTSRMSVPANYGGHELTTGFGRGRVDLPGIVSDGEGGTVDLPPEPLTLSIRFSGAGLTQFRGAGVERSVAGSETPGAIRLDLPEGGPVWVSSTSRLRLHEFVLERVHRAPLQAAVLGLLGLLAAVLARRGLIWAVAAAAIVIGGFAVVTGGTLSFVFARVALSRLAPLAAVVFLILPLILALKHARFALRRNLTRGFALAFASSLTLTAIQLLRYDQPVLLGDPAAYFEMGGRFAEAARGLRSPLDLGPVLSELRAYLALPATGLLYGALRLFGGGLAAIYAVQALAMAVAAGALVSICETQIGSRAALIALGFTLLHPSFSILPGIVQPEPFIMAAWTMAALAALSTRREGDDPRGYLGAGVWLGCGFALHPQGLSFLLLALLLCLLPWAPGLRRRPAALIAALLGTGAVLLPVAAAERFAKPLGYVLDRDYGFFAFTSPHPLGFWLYVDSDGWQGPLRIEDTTYQKELIALKGQGALSSTFGDAAAFALRHPADSVRAVLTNLHRLWRRPDNLFAVPFPLPMEAQLLLHRGLVVLFVLGLPALLGGRLALLALPFVMISMTYPAYHVFNKYPTPALPFTIMGAALVIDRLFAERSRARLLMGSLAVAALGALLPAEPVVRLGLSGQMFLILARGLLWTGLALAVLGALRFFGGDARARVLSAAIGVAVLLASSWSASLSDTERGEWSVPLDRPLSIACRLPPTPASADSSSPPDPAYLLVDAESRDGAPPRLQVNGVSLGESVAMMPTFGLATYRGHRNPATFRQMWRAPIGEDVLARRDLDVQVSGGPGLRFFGDVRDGSRGPRLSIGNWPHLSVYRLMHDGQYRLPVYDAPAQACSAAGFPGRPGVSLVRIPEGEESRIAFKLPKPPTWIF